MMEVGFTCGAFDLLHPGHCLFLDECKRHCTWLVVGLHTNPATERPRTKETPLQTVFERFVQLKHHRAVDEIIPYDSEADLYNILATTKINIRFLGDEYSTDPESITGYNLNLPLLFISRKHMFSSTAIRNKIKRKDYGNDTVLR